MFAERHLINCYLFIIFYPLIIHIKYLLWDNIQFMSSVFFFLVYTFFLNWTSDLENYVGILFTDNNFVVVTFRFAMMALLAPCLYMCVWVCVLLHKRYIIFFKRITSLHTTFHICLFIYTRALDTHCIQYMNTCTSSTYVILHIWLCVNVLYILFSISSLSIYIFKLIHSLGYMYFIIPLTNHHHRHKLNNLLLLLLRGWC